MSPGNKKIKARKIPAMKKEFLVYTGTLIQPALFKEITATNYKILDHTSTGMQGSLIKIIYYDIKKDLAK